jgi:dienelactone hydrolase
VDQYILQLDNELGQPWKNNNYEKYLKLSYPFLHADRIKTPTQFITGEKDFNVPAIGSEQMYQALRSQDIPTELLVYPGQYHGFTQPSFIRDRFERYYQWFGQIPETRQKPVNEKQIASLFQTFSKPHITNQAASLKKLAAALLKYPTILQAFFAVDLE